MPRKKKDPEITVDDLERAARRLGFLLVKPERVIGYFYGIQYTADDGDTVIKIREAGQLKTLARTLLKDLNIAPMQIDAVLKAVTGEE